MISTAEFRNGISIEFKDDIWEILSFQHSQQGRGSAHVATKLRSLRSGSVLENTFRAGEKVNQAIIEKNSMEYLYNTGEEYCFMDNESYEQLNIPSENVADDVKKFLKENMGVLVIMYQGEILGIELSNSEEYDVIEADPAVKGNTVQGASKFVTIETGAKIACPQFVNQGDRIRVDTRTSKYMERVK